MQRVLGIDLGTTNSVMACIERGEPTVLRNREQDELTPSCVALNKDGTITVGRTPKNRSQSPIVSVKRFMGRRYADPEVQRALGRMSLPYKVTEGPDGGVRVWLGDRDFAPEEISACILRKLKEDAERSGKTYSRAIISVPAYFHEPQVAATREAGRLAGFHVMRIIHEPTAAALAYGLLNAKEQDGKTILVYDLGGGTFDVSIMMLAGGVFTELRIGGDLFLGGDNFDQLIVNHILKNVSDTQGVKLDPPGMPAWKNRPLTLHAENDKIALSSDLSADIQIPSYGETGVDIDLTLTRREFEGMIEKLIDHSVEITRETIRDAGLAIENIDSILLVGGSTAIPLVERKLLSVIDPEKVKKDVNPMLCVALGAAVQSTLYEHLDCPVCLTPNSVQNDYCQKCNAPLFGTDAPIASVMSGGKSSPAVVSHPTTASRQIVPIEPQGLKCPECKAINEPGAKVCKACGTPMPITETIGTTPHPIGIELQDGRMSVVLPEGASFPTATPIASPYYTSADGQPRLEVNVREGNAPTAVENDLIGVVTVLLKGSYPRGTPVEVAIGLDSSRNVDISIRVSSTNGEFTRTTIQRNQLMPELKGQVAEARDRLTAFTDRWQEELTPAETAALEAMRNRLDQALSGHVSDRNAVVSIEILAADSDKLVESAKEVRGADALLSNTIGRAQEFMQPEQLDGLTKLADRLERARQRADWDDGLAITQEIYAALDELGPAMTVVMAQTHADQNRLSPSLTHRIHGAVADIKGGLSSNNRSRFEQGFRTIMGLRDEIDQELSKPTSPTQQFTKLQDHR